MSYGAIRGGRRSINDRERAAPYSERAAPYSSTAGGSPLAARVKKVQSSSRDGAQAWREHCDAQGDGTYDPSRYDDGFLKRFLAKAEGGSARPAGGGPVGRGDGPRTPRPIGAGGPVGGGGGSSSLVEQVKELQRSSSDLAEDWRRFCDEECGGMYDPQRHDAGTLKMWLSRFGRSSPGSEGPLTQQVKDLQRSSKDAAEAWRSFCDDEGGGKYDPAAHDAGFLKRFLGSMGLSASPQGRPQAASGGGGGLTDQVKELQRSSKQLAEDWREFCDQEGGGIYDPAKHEGRTLKRWLARVDGGSSWETSSAGGRGSSWETSSAGGGGGSLTQQVKDLQRSSKDATEAWRDYCDTRGIGKYDPSAYDAGFLRNFLSEMTGSPPQVSGGGGRGGGGGLTEQVKEVQRSSMAATKDWRQFCDEECDGMYDPAKHEARTLKKWLARFERMSGAMSSPRGSSWENGSDAGSSSGGGGPLTQQVKDLQRSSKEATDAWRDFCETQGNGKYDPQAYDASFLKKFLSTMGSSPRQEFGGGGSSRRMSGSAGSSLTERVKELQRASKDNADDWRQFCDDEGGGVYDPSKHERSFLKDWMARVSGGPSGKHSSGANSLAQRVKDAQRSSKDIADDWREYCDREGDGRYDPSAHDASFLEKWLSTHSMLD